MRILKVLPAVVLTTVFAGCIVAPARPVGSVAISRGA